jgi:hypothetical protein
MNAFVFVLAGSAVVVMAARYFLRWRKIGRRPSKELIATYHEEGLQQFVNFEKFRQIMEIIAQSYSVPVEKLRMTDTFKTDLGDADSLSLDSGNERAARLLQDQFPGIKLEKVRTIRDLFVVIAEEGFAGGNS